MQLVRLEGARRALADARTLDDFKDVHDKAEALRVYLRTANYGIEMQNECAEIKLRAERAAGEILREMPKHPPGPDRSNGSTDPRPRLLDLGISRDDSSRWQRVASVPEDRFEQHLATTIAAKQELTTASVLDLATRLAQARRAATRTAGEERRAADPVPTVPARLEVADATALPLDSNTVDLTVTSPPYGLGQPYLGISDSALGWRAFMVDWLAEAYRVATDGGRLALNVPLDTTAPTPRWTYAEAVMAALEAGWRYRWTVVWNEDNVTRTVARGSVDSPSAPHVIARVEMIAVFHKGEWARPSRGEPDLTHAEWLDWTDGLWTLPNGARWENHPAPFPEALPERLIKLLSWPGDTVLDPFLGSGTSAVVAHRLGRHAIGFDLVPAYVASARRRLAQAIAKERDRGPE